MQVEDISQNLKHNFNEITQYLIAKFRRVK